MLPIKMVQGGDAEESRDGVSAPTSMVPLLPEDFYWLGQSLRALNVPFFSLLEGGYSEDLPELILAYLKGVEGK